jgi:hypothetical protein
VNATHPEVASPEDWTRETAAECVAMICRKRVGDLGHGYCTYDFFDQCPHRMACARCGFYRPKNSAAALFLDGKKNLLRLQQDIPLTEAEANAVVDGVSAFEKLLAQLSDVPTPEGPTPRQLQSGLVQIKPTIEGSK